MEKGLYDTLVEDKGFNYMETTVLPSTWALILNLFCIRKIKEEIITHNDWVFRKDTDGTIIEIYELDFGWYTQMKINGEIEFDARRFAYDDLFNLIPAKN